VAANTPARDGARHATTPWRHAVAGRNTGLRRAAGVGMRHDTLTAAVIVSCRQLAASMLGVEPFEEASGTGEPGDLGVERSGDLNAPPTPVGELAMADV